jgi:transcriptional regulator with PAS, ATPase and Fis domain
MQTFHDPGVFMQHATSPERAVSALSPQALANPLSVAGPEKMLGSSGAMRRLRETLTRVAAGETTVLVIGESGSGKELVARSLHDASSRCDGPFVAVNCGAIPSGLIEAELFGYERGSFTGAARTHAGVFERACGGTLFLDEITEMPLELQTRLLRVLESRRFYRIGGSHERATDARIVAATNRNPVDSVRDGQLREDLLYRLAVFPIAVPPLRARGSDAVEIAEALLEQLNAAAGTARRLSERSLQFMHGYRWPGNVRELRNVLERAFLLAESDELELAPTLDAFQSSAARDESASAQVGIRVGQTLEEAERALIQATLAYHGGSKPRTAQVLGCSLKTLYNKLNSYADMAPAAGL